MLRKLGIRTRIAGGSLVIAILISLVAGVVINMQIERIVREGTIAVLRSDTDPYVAALHNPAADPLDSPGPAELIAVVAPDGSTPVNSLPAGLTGRLPALVGASETELITLARSSYIVRATTVPTATGTWTVVAARRADAEATVLSQMRLLLIAALSLIALGVAVTAWLLTSASLGPVRQLRRSAEELSDTASTRLLAVGTADDEISQLARTLNDLIERLRASALRERQLVSDASHELGTPLAILSTQLQVAIAEASSVDQLVADMRGAQRNVVRLSALVASLLELSSLEAVGGSGRASALELDREAVEAVDRARFRSMDAGIDIRYDGPAGLSPAGPVFAITPEDFGRMIDNLTGNALRAVSGRPGTVEVRLTLMPGSLRLTVADTGGGMEPGFEAHALDRFSREDRSRRSGSGTGLGLAIVAAIVRNATGTIQLHNRPGSGLTVEIALPQAPPAPAVDPPGAP